jgi:hypothetical protein
MPEVKLEVAVQLTGKSDLDKIIQDQKKGLEALAGTETKLTALRDAGVARAKANLVAGAAMIAAQSRASGSEITHLGTQLELVRKITQAQVEASTVPPPKIEAEAPTVRPAPPSSLETRERPTEQVLPTLRASVAPALPPTV